MRVTYSLKTSKPTTFVEPLVKHIEQNYDLQTAYGFKPLLGKINDLRNKATSVVLRNDAADEDLDKAGQLISAYSKYALIILKRFNWDTNRGRSVQGVQITWSDSFQPTLQFSKGSILFDIFCCYYNLAIIYFTRAMRLSDVDLDGARKEAMTKAKYAAFLLGEMKDKYYGEFTQVGFHDTQFPHLDMLQNLCLGIVYKCLFNTFREQEYKLGINKVAAIAASAAKYYGKAYSVGSTFFQNPSGISDKTKTQLLSLSYIESLYFDTVANTKYAKHYNNLLEDDQSHMSLVIAYEKKAQRLMDIGMKNQSVEQLFNMNKQQKKDLQQMQLQLQQSLKKNLQRNAQIFKQPEIKEENIPPAEDMPKEWVVKLVVPPNLHMENEGEFGKLMSDESYTLALELSNFSASRKAALESSQKKLDEQIEKAYNDSYVNFFLQIQGDTSQKTLPKALQDKLLEIRKQGGKQKIEQQIKMLKDNQANVSICFKNLRQTLKDEESFDMQKRSQYGNQWQRPPSQQINSEYYKNIENLQGKSKIASGVDEKILDKYNRTKAFIDTLDASDEVIAASLPKAESQKFVEANGVELTALKEKTENLKKHRNNLQSLGLRILETLQRINFPKAANQALSEKMDQESIFKTVFGEVEGLINEFNSECKNVKDEVAIITTISVSLNGRNKEQDNSKREFEKLVGSYNEVNQLFKETQQSSSFYTKLNDFISKVTVGIEDFAYARKMSAEDLENSLKNQKGGGSSFNPPQFPNMGPGSHQPPAQLPTYNGPPQGSGFMGSPPQSAFGFNVPPQSQFDPRNANLNDLFRMMGDSFNQLNPFNSNRR